MLSKKSEKALIEWKPINEIIITARFFSKFIKVSLIQVYAPTNEANEDSKNEFMERLQSAIETALKHDMLLITGEQRV